MTLRTTLRAAISALLEGSPDLGSSEHELPFHSEVTMKSGVAANRADLMFSDQRTLSGSSSENLDLAGGSLTDPLGTALTFAKIKAILVIADSDNGGNIVVGGASSNGFTGPFADSTDKIEVPAGGSMMLTAPVNGWTVTANTGDILQIENDDASSATYDIVLIGTSA